MFDINIKEISQTPFNGKITSQLVLEFSGKDTNEIICNTFRRVAYDDLPTYGFPPELINISQNTSIYNNDYMKDHLSNALTVLNIDTGISYLPHQYWKDVDYRDQNREKHSNEQQIDIYVQSHNVSPDIMNVTTNDARIYVDGSQVKMFDASYPPLLIQLRPNETFKCHMRAAFGTGERNSLWASAGNAFYNTKNNKTLLTIESQGQLDEYNILIKACDHINYKLAELHKVIQQKIANNVQGYDSKVISYELEDEDYTIGNLLNNAIQDHKHTIFSGMSKPDQLVRLVKFKIECDDEVEYVSDVIYESIDYLTNIFENIKNKLIKMSNKK
jgi:DNA-directed RNA polymerase subunit L